MNLLELFVKSSHENLFEFEEAQEYLLGRGVSLRQWKKHKIGYVHKGFEFDHSCELEGCEDCKLTRWYKSRSKNMERDDDGLVLFPLTTYDGSIRGFQTRSITGKTFDTFIPKSAKLPIFFGLGPSMEEIWTRDEIVLVEGPFDQLVWEKLISENVVSVLTNSVNAKQLSFLVRFCRNIRVAFDNDVAGQDGYLYLKKREDLFSSVSRIRFSHSSEPKDLNKLWTTLGDVKFKKLIEEQNEQYQRHGHGYPSQEEREA